MKNIETTLVEVHKVRSVTCDSCKITRFKLTELSEFLHIDFIAGYDSIFVDNNRVEADLCQYCVKKLLGDVLRVSES